MTTTVLVLLLVLLVVALVAILEQRVVVLRLQNVERKTDEIAKTMAEAGRDAGDERAELDVEMVVERLDRIERLAREAADREPEEGGPSQLAKEVEPVLRDATAAIEHQLRELHSVLTSDAELSTSDLVTRALARRGFAHVELVSVPVAEEGRVRVAVEARRDGMSYKGVVYLDGTKVVEQRLNPSYPMFP